MSSGKIRTEKECLNCGHTVEHLFCSHCGQKNVEIKESFWHLAAHYITDYFHFDSKLLHSIKPLILQPGFLPKEYMEGRRAKYINPIGSLIFLSTFFFIIFLSFGHLYNDKHKNNIPLSSIKDSIVKHSTDSAEGFKLDSLKVNTGNAAVNNKLTKRFKEIFSEGNETEREMFLEKFKHNFPKVMILLIPFLAFFLWLFNLRHKTLYVEHLIFTVYVHCFVYLLLTFSFLLSLLWEPAFAWSFLLLIIYIILSMKVFYNQGTAKSIVKFILVSTCYSLILLVGLAINGIVSAL